MKMSDPLPRSKSNVTNNRATQTRDAKSSFSRSHCNCNRTTQDPSKLEWIDWQTKMVQRLEKKYSKSVDYKRYVKNSEARSSSFSNQSQLGLESSYNAPANLHSCSSTTYPFHRYGSLSSLQTVAQQMQPHMQSLQQQLPPMNQQMHPIHQVQPLQHQMPLQQHNQQQQELQAMHQQQQLSHILQSQQQNQQLQDLQTFQPQLQPLHQLPPLQQQSLSNRSMPHICLSQQHLQQPLPPIQQQLQPIQQQRLSLLPHHTLSQQSVHQPLQQTLHQQMQAPRHQQMQAHQQQESSLLLQQELQQQQQQQMQPVGGHHAHHVLRPVAPQQLPALRHDEFLAQFPPSLGHARRLHLPPPQLPLRPSFSVPVTTNTQQLHGQFETNPPCEPCPLYGTFPQCPSNSLYQQQYQPYQQNVLGPHNGIQATGDLRPAGVLPALAHEAGHRLRKAPFETRTVSRLSYVPMPFTREPAHRPAEALRLAVRVADGVGPAAAGASTVYARSYMPVGDVASCRRVSMRRSDNLPLTPVPATPLCKVRPPYQRRHECGRASHTHF